jgi:toxin ParE1/3/4
MRLLVAPRAQNDLDEIWLRSRDSDLKPGFRSFPVNNYVVFYRIGSGEVQVLRVLHGSRDAQAVFGEED